MPELTPSENWLYLEHGAAPAAWNMACDQWFLTNAKSFGKPILRTYRWDCPSLSIGYFQAWPGELASRCAVVRRPTGGAMVYHGQDLTFTVVLPPRHPWRQLPTLQRYQQIHQRIALLFKNRGDNARLSKTCQPAKNPLPPAPIEACFAKSSRYDVTLHGLKVAGGAQRVTKDGLLHQGSILAEGQPPVTPAEFLRTWETTGIRFAPISLTPSQLAAIQNLASTRFSSREWNERIA
ncbi:MAG: hypothetical protein PHV34_00690 [Verrucomicrobiae bacterium]|nr:hypothetical protein [Verrucomicrobiae bacterium]